MIKYDITDLDENRLEFINNFIVDTCLQLDPSLDVSEMSRNGRLRGCTFDGNLYTYFLDGKIPILSMDLKLLLDGT